MTQHLDHSERNATERIAVLGAGITGLSAAYRLCRFREQGKLPQTVAVDVWDRRSRVGGVLQTDHRDGFQIEQSADNFITTVPWGLDLCRELGLIDELVQTNATTRRTYVVRRGRLHLLPDGFLMLAPTKLWPLAVTPILSPLGKMRAALELFVPARKDDEDETMARFVKRRLGREVFERLVEPLVSGVYAADMEKLSVLATLPRFRDMEKNHGSLIRAMQKQLRANRAAHLSEQSGARYSMFVTLKKGLSHLCDALAGRLPEGTVRLRTRLEKMERLYDPQKKRVTWNLTFSREDLPPGSAVPEDATCGDARGTVRPSRFTERYDAVLCALPSHEAAKLLRDVFPKLSGRLGRIEHQGTAVATYAFDASQLKTRLRGMGFVVPKIENNPILAGSFSSLKYAHRAPEGKMLVRVFAGGARAPDMAEMPDERLVPRLLNETRKILNIEGEPLFTTVSHWPRTMPQYHLGHDALVGDIERDLEDIPDFALAGNSFHGVGIPNCSHSGQNAAEKLRRFLDVRR